jgi:hypothetical protein
MTGGRTCPSCRTREAQDEEEGWLLCWPEKVGDVVVTSLGFCKLAIRWTEPRDAQCINREATSGREH